MFCCDPGVIFGVFQSLPAAMMIRLNPAVLMPTVYHAGVWACIPITGRLPSLAARLLGWPPEQEGGA